MLNSKDVRRLNDINIDMHNFKLGDYMKENDFDYIEPFYSERIVHADNSVLEKSRTMIAEMSKKLDIQCTVTFNLSKVGQSNTSATYYMGERITLPDNVTLEKGKRLRWIDNASGPVDNNTIVMQDMTVTASYIDNAEMYVKFYNANDRFTPYENIKVELNDNIPEPKKAPVAPDGKKTFMGWYNIPQSIKNFSLGSVEPQKAIIGSPLNYQPPGIDIVVGDITSDGEVNVSDVIRILEIIAESSAASLSEYQKIAADVNEDGTITASDAIKLLQSIAEGKKYINICDLDLYAWWK